jgi:hypothetical protein
MRHNHNVKLTFAVNGEKSSNFRERGQSGLAKASKVNQHVTLRATICQRRIVFDCQQETVPEADAIHADSDSMWRRAATDVCPLGAL